MTTSRRPSCVATLAKPILVHLLATLCIIILPLMGMAQITDIATDKTDPDNKVDTEPSIAVNPINPQEIVIVTFSEPWGPDTRAPVWRSMDGGGTWAKDRQIPQPPSGAGGPLDQKVAFDAAGKLLIAELDKHDQAFIYRQTGQATDLLTAGTAYGGDQPHLDIDRSAASPCFNRLYSPFTNTAAIPQQSTVAISTDRGQTMTPVAVGIKTFANRTTRIALAPNGKAYIIYKTSEGEVPMSSLPGSTQNDFEKAHFRVARSDNCGEIWNALGVGGVSIHGQGIVQTFFTLIASFGNLSKGKVARARTSDAWIAVNPSNGDVYAAYVNRDTSGFGQIYVARSTDQGKTWTSRRVTDGKNHSAYPEIAVASTGTVGVLYIDFDDSGTKTIFRHRFARSYDSGVTWFSQLLQSMDPEPINNAKSGFLWGDYEGLTALGNTFYGAFTGQSIGRAILQLDPIFFKRSGVKPICYQPLLNEIAVIKAEIKTLQADLQTASPAEKPAIVAQIKAFQKQLSQKNSALVQCANS